MSLPTENYPILIFIADEQVSMLVHRVVGSAGYPLLLPTDAASIMDFFKDRLPAAVILGEKIENLSGIAFSQQLIAKFPAIPVILLVKQDSPEQVREALRCGISDYLTLPLRSNDILHSIENCLTRSGNLHRWAEEEAYRSGENLVKRIGELETLEELGHTITSSLDIGTVLTSIVEAAVGLTGAEEGTLLLLDEPSGELYLRASKGFQEELAQTLRIPIQDTLAGGVLRSGQPVIIDEETPKKIKTSYLVHSLIYVPLQVPGKVFGVLGVDNRLSHKPFRQHDVGLLTTLAEYAVIALLNAELYKTTQAERDQIESLVHKIQDGVLVIDQDKHILLINKTAEAILRVEAGEVIGKTVSEVIGEPEILELFNTSIPAQPNRTEVAVEDGRILSVQRTSVPEIGMVLAFHDISALKKLDRIKSDFVSAVSHDLRSPLTAILGYTELVGRVGTLNEPQREFLERIQTSVQNISLLVDDLVNLGRIEAGFDARKESFDLLEVIHQAVNNTSPNLDRQGIQLVQDLPDNLKNFYGNPLQMRRMFENLIDNAAKYSPQGSHIDLAGRIDQNQVILQVRDYGIGIPPIDLPYIFDKYYRASNVSEQTPGSGLGLAIVRSIIEGHDGRIWVESEIGKGSVFTIVLPLVQS